ncbi:hypothetical protein [Streptomyces sp. NPDC001530]
MPFTWPLTMHGYANGPLTTTGTGRRRVDALTNAACATAPSGR